MIRLAVGGQLTLHLVARRTATGERVDCPPPTSLFENNKDALGCTLEGSRLRLEGKQPGRAQVIAYQPGNNRGIELQVEIIPADRLSLAWEELGDAHAEPAEEAEPSPEPAARSRAVGRRRR